MEIFLSTLSPMATLFFCIAIGFLLSKAKILPDYAGKIMAKMETWIFYPALSFMTMVRYCNVDSIVLHTTNILMAAVMVSIAMTISLVLSRFFVKENSLERGVYKYALAFANSGYVGDPLVLALFGESVLAYYKFFCLPLSLVIYTWGVSILTPHNAAKGSAFKRLLNPPTVAMLCGIVMGLLGTEKYMPAFLVSSLDSLKACMGPVAMLLAGVTIARYDFLGMLKNKKVYLVTFLRLIVLPIVLVSALYGIRALACSVFNISIGNDVLFLGFFATATPLGLNTIIFPESYGGNPKTGASMAMISSVFCVITIPLMYSIMVAIFGTPFIV